MSHAPDSVGTQQGLAEYTARWNVLVQLLRQGRSFSGRERNCCFLNTGKLPFADISAASAFDLPEDARAVLPVDWDFDGDLDLLVLNRTAPRVRLLKNQAAPGNRFLAVRLVGTGGNRDAIGARVEVHLRGGNASPIVRTLRAGEGFASQGTKWLHFGLGPSDPIEKLVVRWPWGQTLEYADVVPNIFLEIIEGNAEVRLWRPPEQTPQLAPATPEIPSLPSAARIAVAEGVPMPALRYKGADGRLRLFDPGEAEATLVNLWATWCAPCARELRDLGKAASVLRKEGVRLLALNVDGLRDTGAMEPRTAEGMLDQLEFPFDRGYATDALLTQLEVFTAPLVDSGPSFVMPSSFLVLRSGELAAVYRGPVEVESLRTDLRQIRAGFRGALLPGRWLRVPSSGEYLARVGDALLDQQFPVEAVRCLDIAARLLPQQPYLQQRRNEARRLEEQARQDLSHYAELVRQYPDLAEAHARLGVACQTLGDYEAAVRHFGRSVALAPQYHQARTALAAALASLGEFSSAQQQLRQVLAVAPYDPQATQNMELLEGKRGGRPEQARASDDGASTRDEP